MLEKIKALLAEELGVNEDEITEATSFKEDLGADSLDLFKLVQILKKNTILKFLRKSWRT